ncbi:hypothetical protein [Alkalihalophilus marmarensis]|uniref:Uncharacterized protein n=1 Tax=Alkalihalophilus marmarensis DSM 21297 TaxID=1188261 RepID=U6SJ71_9BACI|nr:hypothetical protein [Alkalihalophilus marmarensis]ERN51633.1 hypothetical protein A33I_20075 [Alkalihalophilus marmarensis DSM 21297]
MKKDLKGGRSYSSFEQRLSSVKLRESLRNECDQYYEISRDIIN